MSGQRRRKSAARGGKAKQQVPTRDFWGTASADAGAGADGDDVELIRPSTDAAAMVRSLGAPPLAGREVIAEHYFAAVYDKAAALAVALAATADLLDLSDEV